MQSTDSATPQQSTQADPIRIIRAQHLGMCFGVRDAIALAHQHAESRPLTILGDLVHNATVSADLRARGIAIAHNLADVTTSTVMVTESPAKPSWRAMWSRGMANLPGFRVWTNVRRRSLYTRTGGRVPGFLTDF